MGDCIHHADRHFSHHPPECSTRVVCECKYVLELYLSKVNRSIHHYEASNNYVYKIQPTCLSSFTFNSCFYTYSIGKISPCSAFYLINYSHMFLLHWALHAICYIRIIISIERNKYIDEADIESVGTYFLVFIC